MVLLWQKCWHWPCCNFNKESPFLWQLKRKTSGKPKELRIILSAVVCSSAAEKPAVASAWHSRERLSGDWRTKAVCIHIYKRGSREAPSKGTSLFYPSRSYCAVVCDTGAVEKLLSISTVSVICFLQQGLPPQETRPWVSLHAGRLSASKRAAVVKCVCVTSGLNFPFLLWNKIHTVNFSMSCFPSTRNIH